MPLAVKLCTVIAGVEAKEEALSQRHRRNKSKEASFRFNLSGKTVMALVNAFQNSSHDVFSHDQQTGEPASRLVKIRSIWPFSVKSDRQADPADSELPVEDAGESIAPSSFIT